MVRSGEMFSRTRVPATVVVKSRCRGGRCRLRRSSSMVTSGAGFHAAVQMSLVQRALVEPAEPPRELAAEAPLRRGAGLEAVRVQWYDPGGITTPGDTSNGAARCSPVGTQLNSARSPVSNRQFTGAVNTR